MNSYQIGTSALIAAAALFTNGQVNQAQASPHQAHHGTVTYEVSVTNLTRGQPLSPAAVYTHCSDTVPLFMAGMPASPELAALAEDADMSQLMASLQEDDSVCDHVTLTGPEGPILPGETAHIQVTARSSCRYLSMAAMLVSTNDAFTGVHDIKLPRHGTHSMTTVAYDAGSEANTEMCSDIPGPPCGSPHVRVTEGAEGHVHVHAGIHGIGDLDPAHHDWRNPVARVTVTRVYE